MRQYRLKVWAGLFLILGALRLGGAGEAVTVWVSDIHDRDEGKIEGVTTLSLVSARNGGCSGKVVVSAPAAMTGLKASLSELKQGASVIPAARTSVRYGARWEKSASGWGRPTGVDFLVESPAAETPAGTNPIWVTVEVPKDAKAGIYAGELRVEIAGSQAAAVPVKLEVVDWTLPETQEYRTWIELIQSPETLAVEYNLPLWSDKHWEMIAKSLQIVGKTGSRVLYVPLIGRTNYGNEQSMVRWIKKGEGKYEHDFSIMEKYLDLAEKHMGKPKLLVLNAWEIYLQPPNEPVVINETDSAHIKMEKEKWQARWEIRDKGPFVTVVDGGKVLSDNVPVYSNPAAKTLWQPLWSELLSRIQKRGLEKAAMLGVSSDYRPTKEEVTVLHELSGGLPWVSTTHHAPWLFRPERKKEFYDTAYIGYSAVALDFQYTINPAKERTYGWKKPALHGIYWRFGFFNFNTYSWIRNEAEANITGNQRGISHLGADFWPCIKDKNGKRRGSVTERFPEAYWHSLNTGAWMLAPGPDGPVATTRFELLREGVQECEARIFLESALTDEKQKGLLGADLCKRAQEILDERHLAIWRARGAQDADLDKDKGLMRQYREIDALMTNRDCKWDKAAGQKWFLTSGWQDRTRKLFAISGEAAKKLGSGK